MSRPNADAIRHPPNPDAIIRRLAARQHGVVSRRQLLAAGVSSRVVEHRLEKGRLDRLHRGVYRVGPAPAGFEREMAAVLACGPEAVLSHGSAASLWKLLRESYSEYPVEVSTRGAYRRPGPGIRVHRLGTLCPDETTQLDGVPITTPSRTILDLASTLGTRELEGALARAERCGLADRDTVATLLSKHRWLRGAPALRALLDREVKPAFTRSTAERRFHQLVQRAHLPLPEGNVIVEGYEVDFLWRVARLVVEVDGFAYHSSRHAFEGDRRRDAVLVAAGFRVLRVTWRQLTTEPEAVAVRLANALVPEKAVVRENPLVQERGVVRENALVQERAIVQDGAIVQENAPVRENAPDRAQKSPINGFTQP